MITLTVKGKDYKLKFGYKSFKKSGLLREVVAMQKKARGGDNEEDSLDSNLEMLEEVFELNSKLVLAALQKYNEEFRVDYDNPKSMQEAIDKADDFMDDYIDEEDSMSVTELFNTLVNELFNGGFLSKKSETLEDALTKQDATVVPIDHKRTEKNPKEIEMQVVDKN